MDVTALNEEQERKTLITRLIIFLAGIYFIQGLSQGGISGLFNIPLSLMLKEGLGFNQQQLAYFRGFMLIPWAIKPLYGLLSDFIPILGYRRRSWYVLVTVLGIGASLSLALFDYTTNQLLILLLCTSLSFAFCDVLCDAIMVEHGKPLGMTDKFQGIQWTSIYVAAILSGIGGGLIAAHFSYQQMFFLMACPSIAVLVIAIFFVPEKRYEYKKLKKSEFTSVTQPIDWFVSSMIVLYALLFLSIISSLGYIKLELSHLFLIAPAVILGAVCYLFRQVIDKKTYLCILFLFWFGFALLLSNAPFLFYQRDTLGFSKIFLGTLGSVWAAGAALGSVLFLKISRKKIFWNDRLLAETNLKNLLRYSVIMGMIIILFGFLLIGKKSALVLNFWTGFIYMIASLTTMVLAAEFCPKGIEGTFFALLMSVINFSHGIAERASGFLFKIFYIKAPENFADNIWAKLLVWLGWPIEHTKPEGVKYTVFGQYYTIGWLIIVALIVMALCACFLLFFAIPRFGDSIKEKKELKVLDISQLLKRKKKN